MHWLKFCFIGAVAVLTGCASVPSHDYTAFRNADPHSILVLPPINNSVEVVAPYSVMSQISKPIAESGYYVFPVSLVQQTFRNNGLTEATDIHAVPFEKIQQIFGADTGLYMTIENYGTSYVVLSSDTVVTVSATLVDLRTGTVLWQDKATASSAETVTDRGFDIAAISANRLLYVEDHNGLLYGPRSPKYGQPVPNEKKQ
jgi:hypothetical protein